MARVSLVVLVLLSCMAMSFNVQALNITTILEPYPDYSLFNQWLSLTGVADEVNNRTAITVLATPNTVLQSYLRDAQSAGSNSELITDTLRYHILLTYFGIPELQKIVVKNYTSVTTLLQTTGRSNSTQGFVEIYNTGTQFLVGHFVADDYGNRTIVTNITQKPYDYSVLEISSILNPLPPTVLTPSPAPSVLQYLLGPAPAPLPSSLEEGTGSYGSVTSISTPLVLVATILASYVALL